MTDLQMEMTSKFLGEKRDIREEDSKTFECDDHLTHESFV